MATVHTESHNGITYTLEIEQDDFQVRGNAMASGDDAMDKQVEDEILARLSNGDTWAWACVSVTAEWDWNGTTFEGQDYLGGCSHRDTADFIACNGYYSDMKSAARDLLFADVERGIAELETALESLRGKQHDTEVR